MIEPEDIEGWRPVVAVPVRNEARRLPSLLAALEAQSWILRTGEPLPVVLVLNNCTDRSLAVVRAAETHHRRLRLVTVDVQWRSRAHVGRARRLAMDMAINLATKQSSTVVFTTDADAQPHPNWIDGTLSAIRAGADAVGGRLVGDPVEEALLGAAVLQRATRHAQHARLSDRLASLVDPLPYDPWPRHLDHTGGSLAVRADVYRAVGGLPPLPFREDLALVGAIRAHGYRLVHPLDVEVTVSARLDGRAPGGMADCLRGWVRDEAEGRQAEVEDPEDLLRRLQMRSAMRDGTHGAEARIELCAAYDPDCARTTPISMAIEQLEQMIAKFEVPARDA